MKYNMEEQEDKLKNESPYQLSDEAWEAMQQRLKAGVLQDRAMQRGPVKTRRLSLRYAAGLAAGLALIVSVYFVQRHGSGPANANPEQQLDLAISGLSDAELNWMHQVNEEELSEVSEYVEN